MGAKGRYKKEFDDLAYKFCLLGATDKQMADFFEVTEQTINNWKKRHPTFFGSVKKGKLPADGEVASALFQRAIGFRWVEQQAFKLKSVTYEGGKRIEKEVVELVDVERQVPPDTAAAFIWLKNRAGWRDKSPEERGESIEKAVEAIRKMNSELLGVA